MEFLIEVNAVRAENKLPPLAYSEALCTNAITGLVSVDGLQSVVGIEGGGRVVYSQSPASAVNRLMDDHQIRSYLLSHTARQLGVAFGQDGTVAFLLH